MMKKSIWIMFACIAVLLCACGKKEPESSSDLSDPSTTEPQVTLITAKTDPQTTEQTLPPEPTETRITFAAAGDNIPHDSVIETARKDATGSAEYDFSKIYAGVADLISSADIAFVNQESPVGGDDLGVSGYPSFNAPRAQVEYLIELGFDVFNIANNHMLDKGAKGYTNTVDYFATLPITMIGGYTKSDYDNLRIVECKGVKIAFLSYTTFINYGHRNDLPASSAYLIPYADSADITRQVGLAKAGADVVIVSFHWGTEDEFGITAEQKKLAKLCADLGVDVVLGHHPHVVGEVAYLTGESGNQTLVAYSLGNFCSTMLYAKNMVGEILTFDIVKDAEGAIRVENALVNPIVSHYQTDTAKKDNQGLYVRYASRLYLMEDYTEALANEHGSQNWGKFTFDTLKKYVTDHTDAEFLPDFLK